ncbi:hypothetical protein [Peristeroidobacter soli]|uniref:hypothetical protein n=1 Tax=Peristeroidobacter soli TaxID=2497877 RepID=UPI00101DEC28|nr:hypothetical protein [Peristeroidobacter soli]
MKRIKFAAAALLLPLTSFAAWAPQPVTITGYYIWDNGLAYIRTTSNLNPGNGCTSSQYLGIDTAASNFKAIWAQILAAHTSGQTVTLYYDGCIGTTETYPKIRAVAVPSIW